MDFFSAVFSEVWVSKPLPAFFCDAGPEAGTCRSAHMLWTRRVARHTARARQAHPPLLLRPAVEESYAITFTSFGEQFLRASTSGLCRKRTNMKGGPTLYYMQWRPPFPGACSGPTPESRTCWLWAGRDFRNEASIQPSEGALGLTPIAHGWGWLGDHRDAPANRGTPWGRDTHIHRCRCSCWSVA